MYSMDIYVVVTVSDVGHLQVPCSANSAAVRLAKETIKKEYFLCPDQFEYKTKFLDFWGKHPCSPSSQYLVVATAIDQTVDSFKQLRKLA